MGRRVGAATIPQLLSRDPQFLSSLNPLHSTPFSRHFREILLTRSSPTVIHFDRESNGRKTTLTFVYFKIKVLVWFLVSINMIVFQTRS